MPLGPQTQVVDGQRNLFPSHYQYSPAFYGPQTTGVPNVSPAMPPFIGASNGAGSSLGIEGVGNYGTAGNNALTTAIAAGNPHSLQASPVWWAIIALLGSILLLRATSFRRTTLEGLRASGDVGPVRAAASEEA